MTSHQRNGSNNEEHNNAFSNRCPAGSHIRTATMPNLGTAAGGTSSSSPNQFTGNESISVALKSFPNTTNSTTDIQQNFDVGGYHHRGQLTDLAYAAEQARVEARRNHKRYTDAIYARRRRLREKDEEKDLIREVESTKRQNAKLHEENMELQSILSNSIKVIEAKGEEDKAWLRHALEQAAKKPLEAVTDELDNKATTTSPMKRKSEHIKIKAKPTAYSSDDVGSRLHSPTIRRRTEGRSAHVVDNSAIVSSLRPLSGAHDVPRELPSGDDVQRRNDDNAIEAMRQASYLQGLQDALLLNQRRDILSAAQIHPQQPEASLQRATAAGGTATQAANLQSALLNDPIHQRAEIDRLVLARQMNTLSSYPDSSSVHSDLSSLLNNGSLTSNGYQASSDLLSGSLSSLGFPTNPTAFALAALQNLNSPPIVSPALALAALQNLNIPPIASPPLLPPSLTAAQLLALNGATNNSQLQMQLGLINAYTEHTNSITSLLQRHQQQQQQLSLLAQIHQHQSQQQQLPNSSPTLPSAKPP